MSEFDIIVNYLELTDEELIEEFRQSLTRREYKRGEVVFDIGEVVPQTYFIISGIARVYRLSQDGEHITTCFTPYGSCSINNSQPFDFVSPSDVGFQFLTPGVCYILTADKLNAFLSRYPELPLKVTALLSKSFDNCDLHKNVVQNYDAEQRYAWFTEQYPELIDKIPHHYIASFLGMTTVTLSRIRSKLHK